MNGEQILQDRKFVAELAHSRPGRILQAHITSVSKFEAGHAIESSAQEAQCNERVLIAAIARSLQHDRPMPCGLPFPLPKYIAICNLSGEQLILHGSNPSILRKLCTRSSVLPPRDVAAQILAFEAFADIVVPDVEKFVLLSYSLPWQAGVGSAFWSLSCCDYRPDHRTVRDRMLTFSSHSHTAFCGKSVLDPTDASVLVMNNTSIPMITAKQMRELSEAFCCCSVDAPKRGDGEAEKDDGGVAATKGGDDASKKQLQLEKIVQGLKAQRAKDHDEIKELKNNLLGCENEMLELVKQCEMRCDKLKEKYCGEIEANQSAFDVCTSKSKELLGLKESQRAALTAELNALKASYEEQAGEHAESKKELKKLRSKMDEMGRRSAAKDQLGNAAASKFKMQIKVLEDALETAKVELRTLRQELERAHSKAMEEKVAAHAKEVAKLKTAVEGKERIVNQLSEVSERREAEIESLQAVDALRGAELEEKERAMEALKAELAEAQAALAKPKVRSVAVSTAASTSTHSCATTQTYPPPPSTPPPLKATTVDADAVTADTAATTAECEASGCSDGTNVLCEKAKVALDNLVAHVLSGHITLPPPVPMMPSFNPQFMQPHPQHQFYAQPPPQFYQQPQFVPQQQQRAHKPHGSVRLFKGSA